MNGRSELESFFDEVIAKGYLFNQEVDEHGHITKAFFSHPESAGLAQKSGKVLVMDCTYKTNKYKMPLLHILGLTAFNKTFTIGYAFLSSEVQTDYIWALNSLVACVPGNI